jgi:NAD+ kinase
MDLKIRLAAGNQTAQLTIDGRKALEITDQDLIKIKKSKLEHHVLRKKSHNYFDLLREKLKFGERS